MARNRYDMDESLEEGFDAKQLKRLVQYVLPHKNKMLGVAFLMLSSSALSMLLPLFFQQVMDYSIPNKDMKSIIVYCILTVLVGGYAAVAMSLKTKNMCIVGQNIIHDIREDLFKHLQKLPLQEIPHSIKAFLLKILLKDSDLMQ